MTIRTNSIAMKFAVLSVLCAGLLISACTNDPEPKDPPEVKMVGGFTSLRVGSEWKYTYTDVYTSAGLRSYGAYSLELVDTLGGTLTIHYRDSIETHPDQGLVTYSRLDTVIRVAKGSGIFGKPALVPSSDFVPASQVAKVYFRGDSCDEYKISSTTGTGTVQTANYRYIVGVGFSSYSLVFSYVSANPMPRVTPAPMHKMITLSDYKPGP